MRLMVFGRRHYFQIFNPVICFVAILMMYMFFRRQPPAKVLFHHHAMFVPRLSINHHIMYPVGITPLSLPVPNLGGFLLYLHE